jgi:hypothetical protein
MIFERLRSAGFDIDVRWHADAVLSTDFPEAERELEGVILEHAWTSVTEVIQSGGGRAQITQRLGKALEARGWKKRKFTIVRRINGEERFARSHEVDHVKSFAKGTLALEIEWNNKDPFFDRDLANFQALHVEGAISVAMIVTRGSDFQEGIRTKLMEALRRLGIASIDDLETRFNMSLTRRQEERARRIPPGPHFAEQWVSQFVGDKFGAATTQWEKLIDRLNRGMGAPCPLVSIGIPVSRVRNSDT